MRSVRLVCVVAALAASLLLAGCIGVGGTNKQVQCPATLGQELIDLKRAKEEGAVTDAEYDRLRNRLMDQRRCTKATE